MSGNYPDHVSHRDFDYSTATCPTCKGETDNFGPHHCDEDCRRGCRLQQAEDCDDCAAACIGCGEKGCKKDRGVCERCVELGGEFDIVHLLNCEVKLKAAEAEVARIAAQVQRAVDEASRQADRAVAAEALIRFWKTKAEYLLREWAPKPAPDGLAAAAAALVKRLHEVNAHPETMAVYMTAQQHRGVVYKGPSYKEPLDALEAALRAKVADLETALGLALKKGGKP